MALVLKKTIISIILVLLAVWVVRYGMIRHLIDTQDYSYTSDEAEYLSSYSEVLYYYGLKAWYENRPEAAKHFFEHAVSGNVLHVDAWLKLAQVEYEDGNIDKARRILTFTDELAGDVVKWKWPQLMLARQLGMENLFVRNLNFVIPYYQLRDQALELMDMYYDHRTRDVLEKLEVKNLPDYLKWLMRCGRTQDTLTVWAKMSQNTNIEDKLQERYVNFLVRQKKVEAAAAIWEKYTGNNGLNNPGFEEPISNNAFAWRRSRSPDFEIKRVRGDGKSGDHGMEITFFGKKNINFHHLRQIVPVKPGKTYELGWWWRSRNITTDQRPFIEIYGYDCKGNHLKSEMIPEDTNWQQVHLRFIVPEECHAAVIGLRRYKSRRFDCKINGALWLDNFELTDITDQGVKS